MDGTCIFLILLFLHKINGQTLPRQNIVSRTLAHVYGHPQFNGIASRHWGRYSNDHRLSGFSSRKHLQLSTRNLLNNKNKTVIVDPQWSTQYKNDAESRPISKITMKLKGGKGLHGDALHEKLIFQAAGIDATKERQLEKSVLEIGPYTLTTYWGPKDKDSNIAKKLNTFSGSHNSDMSQLILDKLLDLMQPTSKSQSSKHASSLISSLAKVLFPKHASLQNTFAPTAQVQPSEVSVVPNTWLAPSGSFNPAKKWTSQHVSHSGILDPQTSATIINSESKLNLNQKLTNLTNRLEKLIGLINHDKAQGSTPVSWGKTELSSGIPRQSSIMLNSGAIEIVQTNANEKNKLSSAPLSLIGSINSLELNQARHGHLDLKSSRIYSHDDTTNNNADLVAQCNFNPACWEYEPNSEIENGELFKRIPEIESCIECLAACVGRLQSNVIGPYVCGAVVYDPKWNICDLFTITGSQYIVPHAEKEYFRPTGKCKLPEPEHQSTTPQVVSHAHRKKNTTFSLLLEHQPSLRHLFQNPHVPSFPHRSHGETTLSAANQQSILYQPKRPHLLIPGPSELIKASTAASRSPGTSFFQLETHKKGNGRFSSFHNKAVPQVYESTRPKNFRKNHRIKTSFPEFSQQSGGTSYSINNDRISSSFPELSQQSSFFEEYRKLFRNSLGLPERRKPLKSSFSFQNLPSRNRIINSFPSLKPSRPVEKEQPSGQQRSGNRNGISFSTRKISKSAKPEQSFAPLQIAFPPKVSKPASTAIHTAANNHLANPDVTPIVHGSTIIGFDLKYALEQIQTNSASQDLSQTQIRHANVSLMSSMSLSNNNGDNYIQLTLPSHGYKLPRPSTLVRMNKNTLTVVQNSEIGVCMAIRNDEGTKLCFHGIKKRRHGTLVYCSSPVDCPEINTEESNSMPLWVESLIDVP